MLSWHRICRRSTPRRVPRGENGHKHQEIIIDSDVRASEEFNEKHLG